MLDEIIQLTGHSCWIIKSCCEFWVQLNIELLFCRDLLISQIDLPFDPVTEWFFHNCVSDVGKEIFWKPWDLYHLREVVGDIRIILKELGHLLDAQAFILRDWYMLNFGVLNPLLIATNKIFEKIYCDVTIRREISICINREEAT